MQIIICSLKNKIWNESSFGFKTKIIACDFEILQNSCESLILGLNYCIILYYKALNFKTKVFEI